MSNMKIVVPCLLSQTCAYCGIGFSDTRKRKYCPGLCAKQAAKRRVKAWWANNRSYSNEKKAKTGDHTFAQAKEAEENLHN